MILIIAGGRHYQFDQTDIDILNALRLSKKITEVVHGDATGADKCGKEWAESHEIPTRPFPADWNDLTKPDAVIRTRRDGTKYDANAGPRRNRQMAKYADAVALFPGGRGTQSMYDEAKKAGITIYDFRQRS